MHPVVLLLLSLVAVGVSQECGVPSNGLLLWLDSADYPDKGYFWPVHAPSTYKKKVYSKRAKFDPKEDAFRITSDRTFINTGINPSAYPTFTMDAWIKLNSTPAGSRGWVLSADKGGFGRSIILHDYRFGGVAIGVGSSYKSTLPKPALGTWVHVVGVFSKGGASSAYYNGQQGNIVSDKMNPTTKYTQIGANPLFKAPKQGKHFMDGWVGVVRFWGRALSTAEVTALYNAGQPTNGHCSPVQTTGMQTIATAVASETERQAWYNSDPDICSPNNANFNNKWPTNLGKLSSSASVNISGIDLRTVKSYVNWKYPNLVFDKAMFTTFQPPVAKSYLYKSSSAGGRIISSSAKKATFAEVKLNVVNTCSGNGIVKNGNCACNPKYSGKNCGVCATGRWGYPSCDYIKWASNVCYLAAGPRADSSAAVFTAQQDIDFADVVLMHRSGYTCNAGGKSAPKGYRRAVFPWECRMCKGKCKLPATPWYRAKDGCAVKGTYRITHGVQLVNAANKMLIPEVTTRNSKYSAIYRPDFKLTGPKNKAKFVKGQKYKIFYGEVARQFTTSDNAGKHCIDVYVRPAPCEDEPKNPANGQYDECEGIAPGEKCPLDCRGGYEASGDAICTGNPNSPWKTPLPTCVKAGCAGQPPYKPDNGNFATGCATTAGSTCELVCGTGFVSKGDAECVNGKWTVVNCHTDTANNCNGAPTGTIANGRWARCGSVAPGKTCAAFCNGGFKKVPGADAKCMNGVYQTVSTPCVPMNCEGQIPIIKNLVNYTSCSNAAGGVCVPNCRPGYRAARSTTCNNGLWNPGHCISKCNGIKCPASTVPCKTNRCNENNGVCEYVSAGTGGACGNWGQCFSGKCVGGSAYCRCQQKYADTVNNFGPRCQGPLMSTLIGSFIEAPLDPDLEFGPNGWSIDNGRVISKNKKWVCTIKADPNLA